MAVSCDTITGPLHERAIMFTWLKRWFLAWAERHQQREIERLHEEGCRLKEEVLKITGGERIPLSPEQRCLLTTPQARYFSNTPTPQVSGSSRASLGRS